MELRKEQVTLRTLIAEEGKVIISKETTINEETGEKNPVTKTIVRKTIQKLMKVRKNNYGRINEFTFYKYLVGIYSTTNFNDTGCHNRILQCMEK